MTTSITPTEKKIHKRFIELETSATDGKEIPRMNGSIVSGA